MVTATADRAGRRPASAAAPGGDGEPDHQHEPPHEHQHDRLDEHRHDRRGSERRDRRTTERREPPARDPRPDHGRG